MKKILFVFLLTAAITGGAEAQVKMADKTVQRTPCTTPVAGLMLTGMKDTTGGRNMADNYKTWENGVTLTVKFIDNGASQAIRDKVMRFAKEWELYGNFKLNFVSSAEPVTNIRIRLGSKRDKLGHNSNLGLDCNDVPQGRQTMNLDTSDFFNYDYYIKDLQSGGPFYKYLQGRGKNFSNYTMQNLISDLIDYKGPVLYNDKPFRGTTLHEFGHALGLLHEQSYPGAIKWKEDTVYKYYEKFGWSKADVDHNVLKVNELFFTNGSAYDPKSVMHYNVEAWQTEDGYSLTRTHDLSAGDKALMAALYPKDKKISTLAVPKVSILNFTKLEVVKDDKLKALVIYPYFEVRTGALKANAFYVARLTTEDGMRYIMTNSEKYNWGGAAATYQKLNLLPNTKKKYNLLLKDMKLILPYREIPDLAGQNFRVEFCIYQDDVATGKLNRFVTYNLSSALSLPQQ